MTQNNSKGQATADKAHALPRFRDHLDRERQDPEFAALYEDALRELRLGLAICELREARGLTQQDVEARTGVTQGTLSRIERGRRPTLLTLQKIAKALNAQIVLAPDGAVSVQAFPALAEAA